ncbi:MAG: B12-binding domain-containing protein, partial [Desulfatirhabdiaceae bacterium]
MAIKDIFEAVVNLDDKKIVSLVQAELDAGTSVTTILKEGLISPMDEVGIRFSNGDMFLPEMLKAAVIMKKGLEVIRPHLTDSEMPSSGKVVLGTVKGDLHDIGKNLVAMMMEGAGFKVVDLGVDIPGEAFVKAAKEHQADIIGLSALLTTTMPAMQEAVSLLRESKVTAKILVGGAPLTESFAKDIGAD